MDVEEKDRKISELDILAFEEGEKGNFALAEGYYDEALALKPSDPKILFNKALMFFQKGESLTGTELLKKAAVSGSEDSGFLTDCGLLCFEYGRCEDAAFFYSLAEKAGGKESKLLNGMGVLNFIEKKYDKAAAFFEQAVLADENCADAWFNLADTYEMLGDKEKERSARKRYLSLEKDQS